MANKKLPSQEMLKKLLRYEPETGKLFWRERTPDMFVDSDKFPAEVNCSQWNARFAEKEGFTKVDVGGYRRGRVLNIQYQAHRVIWKMIYNEEPEEIDHVEGNRSDNRIHMLRASNCIDNRKNKKRPLTNNSGVIGVAWSKRNRKWRARIKVSKKNYELGFFADFDEAVAARKEAEKKYGFHKNHGR